MNVQAESSILERYLDVVSEKGVYPNRSNLRTYLGYLFGNLDFAGKTMLDIGAGAGALGLYGACRGASRVVCLEPEAAGSTAGVRRTFDEMVGELGLTTITMEGVTFQEFDPPDSQFDILVMHDSINHLDEDACSRLHVDERARAVYRRQFERLFAMAADEARLIITDCSRHNFFAHLGLRNPIASFIDWNKHQSPHLWVGMLREVGFDEPRIRWSSYNSLGRFGRILLGNAVAAYFLFSHFCLTMHKPRRP